MLPATNSNDGDTEEYPDDDSDDCCGRERSGGATVVVVAGVAECAGTEAVVGAAFFYTVACRTEAI